MKSKNEVTQSTKIVKEYYVIKVIELYKNRLKKKSLHDNCVEELKQQIFFSVSKKVYSKIDQEIRKKEKK